MLSVIFIWISVLIIYFDHLYFPIQITEKYSIVLCYRLPPAHFLAAAQQSVCLWGSWESTFLCSWERRQLPLAIFVTIAAILKSVLIWLEHRPLVFICNHSRMLSVCKSLKPHPLLHNKVKSRNSRHQTPDTRLEVKFKSVLRIIMAMTIQSSEVKCLKLLTTRCVIIAPSQLLTWGSEKKAFVFWNLITAFFFPLNLLSTVVTFSNRRHTLSNDLQIQNKTYLRLQKGNYWIF